MNLVSGVMTLALDENARYLHQNISQNGERKTQYVPEYLRSQVSANTAHSLARGANVV